MSLKSISYTRIEKANTKTLCTMKFNKDATVTLDFGKKSSEKIKLPTDFVADAVEHYLTHIITLGLKETPCRLKKARAKK